MGKIVEAAAAEEEEVGGEEGEGGEGGEGEEEEPDFTKQGSQVLVCRRTNACPLHRTRKKRCPANCEFRKSGYTSNYAKRCLNTKVRMGRCALLDAYLSKYKQTQSTE